MPGANRLFGFLDLVEDGLYVIHVGTARIEYASGGASRMLGYSNDELLEMTVYDLTTGASDGRRRQVLDEHLREGPGHRHRLEVIRRHRDGSEIPCDSLGQVVEDTETGERKFIVVDRDIRERRRTERLEARRRDLGSLVLEVTSLVLADHPVEEVYQRIVEGTATLMESTNASLVVRDPVTDEFVTIGATGPAATLHLRGEVTLDREAMSVFTSWDEATILDGPPPTQPEVLRSLVGPGVIAPFPAPKPAKGVLTAFRARGGTPFEADDTALLGDLAARIATVVELGRARSDQHRLAMVEDRQRIARDLHDTVIQDLLALGMELALGAHEENVAAMERRDGQIAEKLDEIVRRIRTIVFEARQPAMAGPVDALIRSTVAEAARAIGHRPELTMPADFPHLPPLLVEHLIPVLREALSNVARHAQSEICWVTISVDRDRLTLFVDDDGLGPSRNDPAGTGMSNMRQRAALFAGTVALKARAGGGSRLTWTVRLPG